MGHNKVKAFPTDHAHHDKIVNTQGYWCVEGKPQWCFYIIPIHKNEHERANPRQKAKDCEQAEQDQFGQSSLGVIIGGKAQQVKSQPG